MILDPINFHIYNGLIDLSTANKKYLKKKEKKRKRGEEDEQSPLKV